MSFTADVKKELTLQKPGKKCCQLAQIAGFLRFAGSITLMGGIGVRVSTDNPAVARHFASLIKSYFGTKTSLNVSDSVLGRGHSYELFISADMNAEAILRECGILSVKEGSNYITDGLNWELLRKRCCKKSMLSGIFMAAGSVSSPGAKGHHLEINCASRIMAEDVKKLLTGFGMKPGISERRSRFIVYIKDAQQIGDLLGTAGATNEMLRYVDFTITRAMRNRANRISNCENANLEKTVSAAQKQLTDIRKIEQSKGLDSLPPKLRETAVMRLNNPELSLSELCELFSPALKKSGLNHRFEKLAEIAARLDDGGPEV